MDYPSEAEARLDPSTGKFTDGDPATDLPASRDSADYQNMIFDSLINLIEGAGLTADENDLTLVLQAVQEMTAKNNVLGQAFWHQGETPPAGAFSYLGQELSRTTHAELWDSLNAAGRNITFVTDAAWAAGRFGCWSLGDGSTTFRAPLLPADFIRVWDSAGTEISGHVMGELVLDAMQGHHHNIHDGTRGITPATGGDVGGNSNTPSAAPANSSFVSAREIISDGVNGTPRIADETRVRNVAWMMCFYYQ